MNPHRRGGMFMLVAAWLLILGGAYYFFAGWDERQNNPNTAHVLRTQGAEVTLERNRAGHYVAEGEINGKEVTFLLDTGATWVAVPKKLARELGVKRGAAVMLQTANGPSTGYQTRLKSVRLGAIELKDVAALIAEGIEDGPVLLGMSFLQRLEFTQRAGKLVLRQEVPAPERRN